MAAETKNGGGASSPSPRRVVVAVDESEESMHALSWCLSTVVASSAANMAARAPPPTVVLVHARPPRALYNHHNSAIDGAEYVLTREVRDSMDRYTASAADSVVTKAKNICSAFPNVRVETCVEQGDPRDVICGAAEKAGGADMLVMGRRGHGFGLFLQRALLGSVSGHCMRNCKCPVVVVKRPPPPGGKPASAWHGGS